MLSDVWLDQPKVLEKLHVMFNGFSDAIIPLAFVFIGNFQSTPFSYTAQGTAKYHGIFC
jgi:DNA polymerase epsilon subunit 2